MLIGYSLNNAFVESHGEQGWAFLCFNNANFGAQGGFKIIAGSYGARGSQCTYERRCLEGAMVLPVF